MAVQTKTSLISGVDFVSVPAVDLEASIAFYGETLGLEELVHMPERGFAEFDAGGVTLTIHCSKTMGLEPYRSPAPIALSVDDVPAVRARLEDAGVSFRGETMDTGSCHIAVFCDPNGNALMLHHRYEPRPTSSPTREDWWNL